MTSRSDHVVQFFQYCSVSVMWVFSAAITLWVFQLARVAFSLNDAITASMGITFIALPVYWALAAILTYTFFGLRRARASRADAGLPDKGGTA